jgi:hypothetical protein
MRLVLVLSLSLMSACSGAGCMEYMANTCRLLGGSPDQAALYRSANPGMFIAPVYMPVYQPQYAPQPVVQPAPVSCRSTRYGNMVSTSCN